MGKREKRTFSKEFKEQITQLHLSGKPRIYKFNNGINRLKSKYQ